MMLTLEQALAEINASSRRFYVYILHRPCGAPFYVGKGTSDRIACHSRLRESPDLYRVRLVRKIQSSGQLVGYSIAGMFDVEADAFAEEVRLIAHHGRHDRGGILANLTDGGEGAVNPAASTIAKRVVGLKAAMLDPEYKARAVACMHGAKAARIEGIRRALNSEPFRKAKAAEMHSKWNDTEFRVRTTAAIHKAQDSTWKDKQAAGVDRCQADPDFHRRRNAAMTPDVRARIRQSLNKPECVAKKRRSAIAQRAAAEEVRCNALSMYRALAGEAALPNHRSGIETWQQVEAAFLAEAIL